jgi:phosphohistidine phosphatase
MFLYLVRHGESMPKEHNPEQPLSKQGRSMIRRAAEVLFRHRPVTVGMIIHSEREAAAETARIMTEYVEAKKGVTPAAGLEPISDPSIWSKRLLTAKDDVMIVGHDPHLVKLTAGLLGMGQEIAPLRLPLGGIICIEKDPTDACFLRWMLIPEVVG